jgi:hypothetical protein
MEPVGLHHEVRGFAQQQAERPMNGYRLVRRAENQFRRPPTASPMTCDNAISGGSVRVLPALTLTQRDALGPCSPTPTSGAVGVGDPLAAASRTVVALAPRLPGATSCLA